VCPQSSNAVPPKRNRYCSPCEEKTAGQMKGTSRRVLPTRSSTVASEDPLREGFGGRMAEDEARDFLAYPD
jgi:hypothetical protein